MVNGAMGTTSFDYSDGPGWVKTATICSNLFCAGFTVRVGAVSSQGVEIKQ